MGVIEVADMSMTVHMSWRLLVSSKKGISKGLEGEVEIELGSESCRCRFRTVNAVEDELLTLESEVLQPYSRVSGN